MTRSGACHDANHPVRERSAGNSLRLTGPRTWRGNSTATAFRRMDTRTISRSSPRSFVTTPTYPLNAPSVTRTAGSDVLERIAAAEGRMLAASEEEVESAIETVHTALAHPLLKRALAASSRPLAAPEERVGGRGGEKARTGRSTARLHAVQTVHGDRLHEVRAAPARPHSCLHRRGELRREVPVAVQPTPGVVIEGIVDLAFEEEGVWVVVDFETDHDLERGRERYENQLAWYAAAVTAATAQPSRAILLHV